MKISILSDTHSHLDSQIIGHLEKSDEIWHVGDIGNVDVINRLELLTGNLRAVYGNIDGQDIRIRYDETALFKIDGVLILMTHIAGTPTNYNKQVRALIKKYRPNILVCGHSHILRVENDRKNNLLFVNPGACGHYGFHKIRTIIQFEIITGRPTNMNVIELGRRGKMNS